VSALPARPDPSDQSFAVPDVVPLGEFDEAIAHIRDRQEHCGPQTTPHGLEQVVVVIVAIPIRLQVETMEVIRPDHPQGANEVVEARGRDHDRQGDT
jgi:hypothetical protein